jgi:Growth inhibitor
VRRGELYRVQRPSGKDPKRFRVFVIVSRQVLIDSRYSSVICAPVYSNCEGLATEVTVGVAEGLKHESCIRCDELISLSKSELTNYIGSLSSLKIQELNQALKIALDIPDLFRP